MPFFAWFCLPTIVDSTKILLPCHSSEMSLYRTWIYYKMKKWIAFDTSTFNNFLLNVNSKPCSTSPSTWNNLKLMFFIPSIILSWYLCISEKIMNLMQLYICRELRCPSRSCVLWIHILYTNQVVYHDSRKMELVAFPLLGVLKVNFPFVFHQLHDVSSILFSTSLCLCRVFWMTFQKFCGNYIITLHFLTLINDEPISVISL